MLIKITEQRNDNSMSSILNMLLSFKCLDFKLKKDLFVIPNK